MSKALVQHDFKGSAIAQRNKDGYVNLTQMCTTGGRKVNDYLRQGSTKEYLDALSAVTGIPAILDSTSIPALVNRTRQGVWAHPEVAIDCAQWVSVDLRIWANRTLVRIITSPPETLPPTPEPLALPPVPEISKRNQARKLVDERAQRTGLQHGFLWQQAYRELEYRFDYPIARSRAKNKLEKVEADGQLDNLLAIMHHLWE